jgi:hypothetical protein
MWVTVVGLLVALVLRRDWDLVIVLFVIAFSLVVGERKTRVAGQARPDDITQSPDPGRPAPIRGFSREEPAAEPDQPRDNGKRC